MVVFENHQTRMSEFSSSTRKLLGSLQLRYCLQWVVTIMLSGLKVFRNLILEIMKMDFEACGVLKFNCFSVYFR